jgi:hypothetical protein
MDIRGDAVVASRRLTANQWFSSPPAADYISQHWVTAAAEDPGRFADMEFASARQLYASTGSGPTDYPTDWLWHATNVRTNANGAVTAVLEFVPAMRRSVLAWRCTPSGGPRTLAAVLPDAVSFGEISLSSDGSFLLAGSHIVSLISLEGRGQVVLGDIRAACWFPEGGPSTVLAASGPDDGPTQLSVWDLETDKRVDLCHINVRVDTVSASASGEIAVVINAAEDGGFIPAVAIVDPRTGTYELILPTRFQCGPFRGTERPRWIDVPTNSPAATGLSSTLAASLSPVPAPPIDVDAVFQELVARLVRRLKVLEHHAGNDAVLAEVVSIGRRLRGVSAAGQDIVRHKLIPMLGNHGLDHTDRFQSYHWAVDRLSSP